jgi:hypothetical protein
LPPTVRYLRRRHLALAHSGFPARHDRPAGKWARAVQAGVARARGLGRLTSRVFPAGDREYRILTAVGDRVGSATIASRCCRSIPPDGYHRSAAPTANNWAAPGVLNRSHQEVCSNAGPSLLTSSIVLRRFHSSRLDVLENCEHQSVRRRQWQLFRLDQRRRAAQSVAGVRRCSGWLAGGFWGSGPLWVSRLHRTEVDRYPPEESARKASYGPGFR